MKKHKYLKTINEFFENLFNDEELMKFAQIVLKGFGYKDLSLKNLGESGANGNAFLTSDNKVLKITKDPAEALNADSLSKMNLKHFIKYLEVKRLEISEEIRNKMKMPFSKLSFGIIMEKINPLKQDSDVVGNLLGFYICRDKKDREYVDKFMNYNFDSYEDFIKENNEERFKKVFGENPNYETYKKYYTLLNALMKEAKDNKIILGDVDTGNLGFNSSGVFITFDVGGVGNAFNSDGSKMSKDQRISDAKKLEVITPENF